MVIWDLNRDHPFKKSTGGEGSKIEQIWGGKVKKWWKLSTSYMNAHLREGRGHICCKTFKTQMYLLLMNLDNFSKIHYGLATYILISTLIIVGLQFGVKNDHIMVHCRKACKFCFFWLVLKASLLQKTTIFIQKIFFFF